MLKDLLAKVKGKFNAKKTAKSYTKKAELTPKEIATKKGEPYIEVLTTQVNKDNIRNGFFELDWNEQFIVQLKQEGYGFDGDKDEEIVDRWFREVCRNVVAEEEMDVEVRTGNLNVENVKKDNE